MIVGIIAEYNPFHNGHRYQIEQIKKEFPNAKIIVLMSGSFTQRGEPAILDKFTRAELAIKGGCDLVLELPFLFAVRSAQDFARGGINILKNLGVVDFLAFGAEISDLELLKKVANFSDTVKFNEILQQKMNKGSSYANAICQTLSKLSGIGEKVLRLPNIILSIEYLRSLKNLSIQPLLIPRILSSHNDENLNEKISSASAIRKEVYSKNPSWLKISDTIDNETLAALKSADLPDQEKLFLPLMTKIICSNSEELKKIYGMNEGLENKIISVVNSAKNYEEMVNLIVSRRYTRSKVQRLLLYLLIGLEKNHVKNLDQSYARILAFNNAGRELIQSIKKTASIPLITKAAKHITSKLIYENSHNLEVYQKILRFDIISTDIFSMLHSNFQLKQDFIHSPIYVK